MDATCHKLFEIKTLIDIEDWKSLIPKDRKTYRSWDDLRNPKFVKTLAVKYLE